MNCYNSKNKFVKVQMSTKVGYKENIRINVTIAAKSTNVNNYSNKKILILFKKPSQNICL